MTAPQSALVFAAGLGTRMGVLSASRPKPLIAIAGTTLLDHALDIIDQARLQRVAVNTHYRAEMISNYLKDRDIELSYEADLLETGGGLRAALPKLKSGPVVTLNSDAVWRGANPISQLIDHWPHVQADALLLCIPRGRARGHTAGGDFRLDDGRLSRGEDLVYTGAQIIDPKVLVGIPDRVFSLNLAWDRAALHGRLHGMIYDGDWCDVGRPENVSLAEDLLSSV